MKDTTNLKLNETIDAGPIIEAWSFTTAAPSAQFTEPSYSANEIDGSVLMTVTLNGPSAESATVTVSTSDDTAVAADSDYVATITSVTFDPGDTVKSVAIPISNDSLQEGNETFSLTLSAPMNALIGSVLRPATAPARGMVS